MLIDDAKGTLAALRTTIKEEKQIKSSDDLNVGDIIYQCMDKNDGLILKDRFDTRNKFIVIVGKSPNNNTIAVCFINSNLNFYEKIYDRNRFQYTLNKDNYPRFLTKDSRLDCSSFVEINVNKVIAVKAEKVGKLNEKDKHQALQLVKSSDYINNHKKKAFQIL